MGQEERLTGRSLNLTLIATPRSLPKIAVSPRFAANLQMNFRIL
ncbi:MAG TPA: hypothetical protein V6D18_05080 [Thermosynechococcaceae cyanobacterium]